MTYERVQPGHPSYERVQANLAIGQWICDSVDHNDDEHGCSNPDCFKHDPPPEKWAALNRDIDRLWGALRSDPKHLDQFKADRPRGPEVGEL